MLNIRTGILSVILIVILVLTASIVTARTETAFNASGKQANLSDAQELSTDLNKTHTVSAYRSQFGECFDVSIQELEECQDPGQPFVETYRPSLDGCFDVSISDIASCREADQATSP